MAMHGCRMKIFAYESIFFRLSGQVAWAPISQPWRGVFGLELVIAGFMVRFSCNVRLSVKAMKRGDQPFLGGRDRSS